MRILLLVVYYLPSTMSSAKLIHDLAAEFLRRGHEPIVVAPDENILADTEIANEGGIKVLRIRTGKIKTAPRWVRGFNEARLSNIIWEKGRRFFEKNPCDLIVYYSPTIFFGSLVKRLKKHFACPSYLILRDIFPQWAVDAGVLSQGLIYKFFKLKERQNYDAADIIGVQSPANLRYFEEEGLNRKYRLEVLFNWAALAEENVQQTAYRERLGLQGKVVFFYGGNIGVAQDMDNLVRLAINLQSEESAYFLLVGDGSEVPRLRADIASKGLTNIAIYDAVGQREYLSMLSEFDVGLISLARGLRTQNFPGKMLGYMYHSMAILASINPWNDLKEILEDRQAGVVCTNGEDDLFAAHAKRLVRDENYRRLLGKNARTLLESTFSVSKAAGQILVHFSRGNYYSGN
jgi:glycosyltransferase involved in cell wall biosynthesis